MCQEQLFFLAAVLVPRSLSRSKRDKLKLTHFCRCMDTLPTTTNILSAKRRVERLPIWYWFRRCGPTATRGAPSCDEIGLPRFDHRCTDTLPTTTNIPAQRASERYPYGIVRTMWTHGYPGRPSCDEIGLPDFSTTAARIRFRPLPTYQRNAASRTIPIWYCPDDGDPQLPGALQL